MSNIGIFVAGTLVTLVVAFALIIVIWGAIMDGREEEQVDASGSAPVPSPARPAETRAESRDYEPIPGRPRIGVDRPDSRNAKAW